MKDLIYPLLKEDYVSPHLQEEAKKREIPIIPQENGHLPFYTRGWLQIKLNIKKILNKLWKRKYQQ